MYLAFMQRFSFDSIVEQVFFYEDRLSRSNVKLRLFKIVEVTHYFLFVSKISLVDLEAIVGLSRHTLVDRTSQCCDVAVKMFPKLVGTAQQPV